MIATSTRRRTTSAAMITSATDFGTTGIVVIDDDRDFEFVASLHAIEHMEPPVQTQTNLEKKLRKQAFKAIQQRHGRKCR